MEFESTLPREGAEVTTALRVATILGVGGATTARKIAAPRRSLRAHKFSAEPSVGHRSQTGSDNR
jgi:hypothetical protein